MLYLKKKKKRKKEENLAVKSARLVETHCLHSSFSW